MLRPKISSWISDLAGNVEKRRKNSIGTKFSAKKKNQNSYQIYNTNIHDFNITYVVQFISCSLPMLSDTYRLSLLLTHKYSSQGPWAMKRIKGKSKVHPGTGHEGPEGKQMYSCTLSLTQALDRGGWSTPRPRRFTPGKESVPNAQETEWVPGPVWKGAENLAPSWDSIPAPSRPQRVAIPTELSRPRDEEDARTNTLFQTTCTFKHQKGWHLILHKYETRYTHGEINVLYELELIAERMQARYKSEG